MYRHQYTDNQNCGLPVGKAVCVGRNYREHVAELNNEVPEQPLLFIKSNHCFVDMAKSIIIPQSSNCHNELEIALLIGEPIVDDPIQSVYGVGLALDLTLRDVQSELKEKGHPWERAKAFNGSCPVSAFVPIHHIQDIQALGFTLTVNHQVRQQGNSADMLFPVVQLLKEINQIFTLYPGDIVLTGTPKGVAPLKPGDQLQADLTHHLRINTKVQ